MNGLLNKGERKQIVLYVIKSGIVLLFCVYWMIGIKGEWSYYCVANESKDLFGDCMVWLFDFIYSGIVLGIIGYSIFKMDSIVKHVNYNKWYIPASYSFLGTCGVGFINNPMNERINKVASFTREIGISAFYDVDVSKRVNHFYVWLLFITVSFVILYCFACYVRDDSEKNGLLQNRRFINRFIVVADAVMLIESSNFFSDRTDGFIQFHISVYFIKLLAVCFFIFFVTNNYCKMKLEYYYYALICSLPISLSIGCLMGLDLNEGKTVFGIMIIIAGSVIAFCMFKGKTHISKAILLRGGIWIASLPLFSSLYTECLAICNRNEIFIRWPIIVYIIGIIILGLLVLGLSALQMNMLEWQKSKTLIYSLLILGVTSLSAQAQIVGKYDPHIYEGANYGVLISDFLNYGRVPIVEHYGGHMMTGVWEGLLYGWLNNDFLEAYVSPYSQYVNIVIVFIFWLMIRELIDEDIAFLITLVLPFFSMFEYYGMGVMCCLFLKQYIRKNNYRNAFGLALSCVWTGLYRLDMGVAFVLAIISVLIIWCIIKKEGARLVKVLISGAVVGLIVAGIWMGVCYSKAINVVDSIQDFVAISSSNNTWAYATIGDSTFIGYSWYYYILPLAVMIGLCVVLKGCIHTKSEDLSIDMMILAIGFSFVFNYSRGLVRHSLYESATKVIVWSGYIFLVLVLIRFYKNCTATFVVALMSFIIIEQALSGGRNLEYSSIMDTASSNAEKAIECWASDVEGNSTSFFEFMNQNEMVIDRVDLSEELQQYKDDYSAVIGDLLTEEETFVDFTNNSILYPLLGKEDPAYISQTPMQLSGEYAQMRFIKDMNRAPIV